MFAADCVARGLDFSKELAELVYDLMVERMIE
jgi:hypothetical protein